MKRMYEEPEILIRSYELPVGKIVMTSDPTDNGDNNLHNAGEDVDYFPTGN